MVKKIIAIGAVLVMMFSFTACPINSRADWDTLYETANGWGFEGSCDTFVATLLGLDGEKNDRGNANLDAYGIYKKYHSDYGSSEEEWKSDLLNGKLAGFFSLKKAYNNGWFTQENVRSIVYYIYAHGDELNLFYSHNQDILSETFTPSAKSPETLDKKTENRIKQNFINKFGSTQEEINYYSSDFMIKEYCGTYNGCIVMLLSVTTAVTQGGGIHDVAGVLFDYSVDHFTYVWKY